MSPEKRWSKNVKNARNDESLPFDVYDDSGDYSTRPLANSNLPDKAAEGDGAPEQLIDAYDVDDEEDFIKVYFASGTVLKPSHEPYDLRSKIHRANRELANDDQSAFAVNAPGKVKFDDTVVVLDSFDDIGTVSIGTEKLQGSDNFSDQNDAGKSERPRDGEVLAAVDLSLQRHEEDDQNDVVVCSSSAAAASAADKDPPRESETADTSSSSSSSSSDSRKAATASSVSFSRSFSSESADDRPPPYVNVCAEESGDEFRTIMERNRRARDGSAAAIDEHVTYFPELFTHAQYRLYGTDRTAAAADESSGRGADDSAAAAADIYVPKRLDANVLRTKLKEISKERKIAQPVSADCNRGGRAMQSTRAKTVGSFARKKTKPEAMKLYEKKTCTRSVQSQHLQQRPAANGRGGKPRATTYYFELDPKGKLKPLDGNGSAAATSTKFFRINLKAAAENGEDRRGAGPPRITRTPNAELFLEFRAADRGAKLIVRKKKPEDAAAAAVEAADSAGSKRSSCGAAVERPRLPGYNGLRSEYGLSAEQLLERRKARMERERQRRESKQRKREEEQRKRVENEKNFYKWLQQKKQLLKKQTGRHCSYPMNRLTVSSARASVNYNHGSCKQRKGSFALEELLKMKDENNGSWFKF